MSKNEYINGMLEYEMSRLYSNILCFSTTRHGGHSKGNYATFNCNPFVNDIEFDCKLNTIHLQTVYGLQHSDILFAKQTHSTNVLCIDDDFIGADHCVRKQKLNGVDALITDHKNVCITVFTADCVPIALYDTKNTAVGVVHAGWRGTNGRILLATLQEMNKRYGTQGENIVAAIGPSISVKAFEVGNEVYDAFRESGFDMESIAQKNADTGKWHIDLWQANKQQLIDFGVDNTNIEVAGICTYTQYKDFFSARRLGINSGRMTTGIMIK